MANGRLEMTKRFSKTKFKWKIDTMLNNISHKIRKKQKHESYMEI